MDLFGAPLPEDDHDLDEIAEGGFDLAPAATQPLDPAQRHPRAATACLGHDEVEAQLVAFFNAGRMPHALVFTGIEGVGKSTMAFRLARFLLTRPPQDDAQDSMFGDSTPQTATSLDCDPAHPALRRILSGAHADLLVIERSFDEAKNRKKGQVDVAEARKVAPFLRRTAADGGWRIVIIDDADTMNRNAQNAILKILEEPPDRTLLILIAHRAGGLIPTIRSRTRTLHFNPLSEDHFNRLLELQGHRLDYNSARMVLGYAAGSIGKAVSFIDEGGMEALSRILQLLDNMPRINWVQIHLLGEEVAQQDQAYACFHTVICWLFRQLAVIRAKGVALPLALDTASLRNLLERKDMIALAELSESLDTHFRQAEHANLDKRAALLEAFAMIERLSA